MLALKPFIQVLTIIFALAGAYLMAEIAYAAKRGKDGKLLRARAFLNESFLHDNWKMLFLASLIFLINAVIEINDMFGVFLRDINMDFLQEMVVLGILGCSVITEYKWFKLIKP